MQDSRREEINAFIKANQKTVSREQLDKMLYARFKVRFTYRKYKPHQGLKERVRNLKRLGLTEYQAMDRLMEVSQEEVQSEQAIG
jgi:hypothetical protein